MLQRKRQQKTLKLRGIQTLLQEPFLQAKGQVAIKPIAGVVSN